MLNLIQGPPEASTPIPIKSSAQPNPSSSPGSPMSGSAASELSAAKTHSKLLLSETDQEEEEWSTLARLSSIIGTSSGDLSFGDSWLSGSSESLLGTCLAYRILLFFICMFLVVGSPQQELRRSGSHSETATSGSTPSRSVSQGSGLTRIQQQQQQSKSKGDPRRACSTAAVSACKLCLKSFTVFRKKVSPYLEISHFSIVIYQSLFNCNLSVIFQAYSCSVLREPCRFFEISFLFIFCYSISALFVRTASALNAWLTRLSFVLAPLLRPLYAMLASAGSMGLYFRAILA